MRHQGGGIALDSTNVLSITNTLLRDNVAGFSGGAVWTQSGGTFVNTTMKENTASGYGGGVDGRTGGGSFGGAWLAVRSLL